jgi:hypothetical protein
MNVILKGKGHLNAHFLETPCRNRSRAQQGLNFRLQDAQIVVGYNPDGLSANALTNFP